MSILNIKHIALLIAGNYLDHDPYTGLNHSLDLFSYAESLGFNGAWIRQRHLESGVSSASTFLAAASQRTSAIELGAAVIQMGYESPFRLAEDLATVDILSRQRLNIGLSAGQPAHLDLIGSAVWGTGWQQQDFSYRRIEQLRHYLQGQYFGEADDLIESPAALQRPRIQPYAAGLSQRLWYGGGSFRSVTWAAEQGFNLLLGNLCSGEGHNDFYQAQSHLLAQYRRALGAQQQTRIAAGRVIVPTDSADQQSLEQYRKFAQSRQQRTLAPVGERGTVYSHDLVGRSEEIVHRLMQDPVLQQVQELRIELPYAFSHAQYQQILFDFSQKIAPYLGWEKCKKSATSTAPTAEQVLTE
ncbi:LLM class flavin-dependent oxidoreductase [Acinetobacter larvae]|uniref:Monooxygenase n=1 Tax=Acinetobacter larvae TaxID=1789224 RepID=A0A1B2M1Q2_9GAMM|nr:LLM class flavin-dependent oxidoreductase [Acinetobacter larvae]AOA59118.1 monooxygenase [Acinetobacter larvae]